MNKKVAFCYLGPPKTASTWIFRCLAEHPGICASQSDELYYFDQYYGLGEDWYHSHFLEEAGIRIDCTPSTIAQRSALERMIEYNPSMKVCFGLRNPIDRAFSAYWHVKKRSQVSWGFENIFGSYPAYLMWLAPGLFAREIAFLLRSLPKENILFFKFEKLSQDRAGTIKELYQFIGVDDTYSPKALYENINFSGPKTSPLHLYTHKILKRTLPEQTYSSDFIQKYMLGKKEYIDGVPIDLRKKLLELCEQDIRAYEEMLSIDLSSWRDLS